MYTNACILAPTHKHSSLLYVQLNQHSKCKNHSLTPQHPCEYFLVETFTRIRINSSFYETWRWTICQIVETTVCTSQYAFTHCLLTRCMRMHTLFRHSAASCRLQRPRVLLQTPHRCRGLHWRAGAPCVRACACCWLFFSCLWTVRIGHKITCFVCVCVCVCVCTCTFDKK